MKRPKHMTYSQVRKALGFPPAAPPLDWYAPLPNSTTHRKHLQRHKAALQAASLELQIISAEEPALKRHVDAAVTIIDLAVREAQRRMDATH